ncbi:MAG TPA: molybdopterin-dependent oxidoreductase [Steroidobacteraceae bacterium]|nr:molybdopterin-dependent oxidoreductase [Steroidobacteraceae bacterium]
MSLPLPPGQRLVPEFPRFGVARFARRKIDHKEVRVEFSGALARAVVLTATDLAKLQRRTVTLDFHCAAGWSYEALTWSGFRFIDVWNAFVAPHLDSTQKLGFAILRGRDGYRTSLPLADLLAPDVLIADRLNDQPLTVEHGAPVRLIAPAHYGYKSAKHLASIELRLDDQGYRPLLPRLLDHPRARVALEERGQILPGWLLRYAFRPLIQPIIDKLKRITAT